MSAPRTSLARRLLESNDELCHEAAGMIERLYARINNKNEALLEIKYLECSGFDEPHMKMIEIATRGLNETANDRR